jgi:ABC-type uncharacterized transport system permease subunit
MLLSRLPLVCLVMLLLLISLILVVINSLLELVSVFSLDNLVLRRDTIVIVLSCIDTPFFSSSGQCLSSDLIVSREGEVSFPSPTLPILLSPQVPLASQPNLHL